MPVDPRAYLQPLRNSTCFRIKISKKFGVFFGGGGIPPSPLSSTPWWPAAAVAPSGPLQGMPRHAWHALKEPLRPQAARGSRRGRGRGYLSPKNPPKKIFLPKTTRRGHCGHRPPEGARGGLERDGVSPPQIFPQFFLPKFFSWRSHCGRRPPGGAREGGGGTKGGFPFPKCLFPQQFFPEGETGRMPPEGARGGGPGPPSA